jgi:hypothetical protein
MFAVAMPVPVIFDDAYTRLVVDFVTNLSVSVEIIV